MSAESPPLPTPPRIAIDVARDRTSVSRASGGFVNVRRLDLTARYPDGSTSEAFAYDIVVRDAIDAVVLLAYERVASQREIYVRSAVRAPLMLRDGFGVEDGNLWELPAGIIDPNESPRDAAARELHEELGFRVEASALVEFAPWTWVAPGFIAERQHFYCIDVTGVTRGTPTEDGSTLERGAAIVKRPLANLLARCRAGDLRDAKTELALRRFAELA
jgi:ADP-ribose pyrophosphatase